LDGPLEVYFCSLGGISLVPTSRARRARSS